MKKIIISVSVLIFVMTCAFSASADTLARDAMIKYSGTEAFTNLTPAERESCVNWLVYGGTMNDDCKAAVMKLTAQAPEAVTSEQREALIAEASGQITTTSSTSTSTTSKSRTKTKSTTTQAPKEETPTISKNNDNTGTLVAVGLLGVLAGLIIHNNVKHRSGPVYTPEPPRPAPNDRRAPAGNNMPPQPQRRPDNQRMPPPNHNIPRRR